MSSSAATQSTTTPEAPMTTTPADLTAPEVNVLTAAILDPQATSGPRFPGSAETSARLVGRGLARWDDRGHPALTCEGFAVAEALATPQARALHARGSSRHGAYLASLGSR